MLFANLKHNFWNVQNSCRKRSESSNYIWKTLIKVSETSFTWSLSRSSRSSRWFARWFRWSSLLSSLSRVSLWSSVSGWVSDIYVIENFELYSNSNGSSRVKRSKAFCFHRCKIEDRDAFDHAWFNESLERSLNFIIVDFYIRNKTSRMIENRIIDNDDVFDISTFIALETFSCVDDNVSFSNAIFSFFSCFDALIFCSLKYRQWKCTFSSFRISSSAWSYHRSCIL